MQTKQIHVPARLTRAFQSERVGKHAWLSISSDAPYRRYDYWEGEEYWEVLDHSAQGIDTERLDAGLPVCFNHATSQHLATAGEYRIGDGKLSLKWDDLNWSGSDFAQSKKADMESGALPFTSISYELSGDGVCIGAKDGLPVYRFHFKPYEGGPVVIPADSSVGVGRGAEKPEAIMRAINIVYDSKTNNPERMNPNTENPPMKPAHRLTRSQSEEHAEKIRAHYQAMETCPQAWKIKAQEIGERACAEGRTYAEFRAELLPHLVYSAPGSGSPGDWGSASASQQNARTLGGLITAHRSFAEVRQGGRKSVSMSFPHVRNVRELRGILTTENSGTTVQHTGQVVFATQRLGVADLLAQGTTQAGSIRFPQETATPSLAGTVAETAQKPELNLSLEPQDAAAKKIAAFVTVSDEMLADAPATADYLNARLTNAVEIQEEFQILSGDGIGANMKGIRTWGGLQVYAKAGGDTAADAIRRGIGAVDANTDFITSGIVLHPNDWMNLELLKDLQGNYLAGNIFVRNEMGDLVSAPSLWGRPVVVSKGISEGVALVGAFNVAAQLFRRTGLLIEMSNQHGDNFTRNLVTVLAELRAALAVYAPSAFCEVTL